MAKKRNSRLPAGIKEREDGRFKLRATATCERTGRRIDRQMTLPPGTKLSSAVAELEALRADVEAEAAGVATDQQSPQRETIADYAERWLIIRSERLRPRTAQVYATTLDHHVLPRIGGLYVDALNRSDVEAWVAWAEQATRDDGKPYSASTVRNWWTLFKQLVRCAAAEYDLPDPTRMVDPPRLRGRKKKREQATLTRQQVARLLEVLEPYPHYHAITATLALTGIRAGEMRALLWEHVDFDTERMLICRSAVGSHVGPTKTYEPREVPIHDMLLEILQRHRRRMIENQHPGLSSGLVFPARHGGMRRSASPVQSKLKIAALEAGIDIRVGPQVLRRTHNTLLLEAGVDRIILQEMMGHSSEEMTERYSSVSLDAKRAAIRGLWDE